MGCSLDSRTNIISTSEILNATFCNIMNQIKDYIPPFVTVKRYSTMMFFKDDVGNFFLDVDITAGMLHPNTLFQDYKQFVHFLVNDKGESHCINCGWLYDGNAQRDCWKYSDMETE